MIDSAIDPVALGAVEDQRWMRHALALADRAQREFDEIPVGAVLVGADGNLLGEGWNLNIATHDPSAHAEIVAMREGGRQLGNHRLIGSTLYVTLEPCAMCAMALVHARIARLVFAATDPKTGACGSVFDLVGDPRHNHRVVVHSGVLAEQASLRLSNYFRAKRGRPLLPGLGFDQVRACKPGIIAPSIYRPLSADRALSRNSRTWRTTAQATTGSSGSIWK